MKKRGYVLQYFEDIIEFCSIDYYKTNYGYLNEADHSLEIRNESYLVQKKLRKIFYSWDLGDKTTLFFNKINIRVIDLLKIVEENTFSIRKTYITDNRRFILNELLNYQAIHYQLCGINRMLVEEFGIGDSKNIVESITLQTEEQLHQDFIAIRNSLKNENPVPLELIASYDLSHIDLEMIMDGMYESQEELEKKRLQLDQQRASFSILDFIKRYISSYEHYGKPEHRFFYAEIRKMLKKSVSDMESDEQKLIYLEDFFLHTSICHDLVIDYFQDKINWIQDGEEIELVKYLNQLKDRLDEIQERPKFRKYHNRKLERSPESTIRSLRELIDDAYRVFDLNGEKRIVPVKDDEQYSFPDKIDYKGSAESLGLLFSLLFKADLINYNNRKVKISQVLALAFNANQNSFKAETVCKAFTTRSFDHNSFVLIEKTLKSMKIELANIKAAANNFKNN